MPEATLTREQRRDAACDQYIATGGETAKPGETITARWLSPRVENAVRKAYCAGWEAALRDEAQYQEGPPNDDS